MKYAVDYRNMHTAIHGLILFDTRKKAEQAFEALKNIKSQGVFLRNLQEVHAWVEEIDYKKLTEVMKGFSYAVNDAGYVHKISNNVRIINYKYAVDIWEA